MRTFVYFVINSTRKRTNLITFSGLGDFWKNFRKTKLLFKKKRDFCFQICQRVIDDEDDDDDDA